MSIDSTPQEFHDHPWPGLRYVVIALLIAFFVALAAAAPERSAPHRSIRGVSDRCTAPECVATQQVISLNQARRMKRELRDHALLVDISSAEEIAAGLAPGTDLQVAFMEAPYAPGIATMGAPMEFRLDFALKMDDALRAAHMRHDDPVMLMAPTAERAVLAALLLQERGYSRILVVDN